MGSGVGWLGSGGGIGIWVSGDWELGIRNWLRGQILDIFVKFEGVGIREYPGGDCGLGIRDLGVGTWGIRE